MGRRQPILALAVLACRTNVVSAWAPPTKVAGRGHPPPPPSTTPSFPARCASSISTAPTPPSGSISHRKRGRRVPMTRVPSSAQAQSAWWSKHDLSYDSALRALRAFHKEHGDLAIPGRFVVPSTDGEKKMRVQGKQSTSFSYSPMPHAPRNPPHSNQNTPRNGTEKSWPAGSTT